MSRERECCSVTRKALLFFCYMPDKWSTVSVTAKKNEFMHIPFRPRKQLFTNFLQISNHEKQMKLTASVYSKLISGRI